MFVGMWMTENLVTAAPSDKLEEIAHCMAHRRIRRLPVVEPTPDGMLLLGLISHSDVLHAFPLDINPFSAVANDMLASRVSMRPLSIVIAADIMCTDLATTVPEQPIEQAAKMMRDRKIGALPVVRGKHLVGLITESDIFRAFTSIFESTSPGVRLTFDISRGEDVFPLISSLVMQHHLQLVTFATLQKHVRPVCVVEISGQETEALVEDVWGSGHPVVSVIKIQG